MTPTELARARELCEAATPGPWHSKCANSPDGIGFDCRVVDDESGLVMERWIAGAEDGDDESDEHRANAQLIAASRTLVPALLDELAQARAALADAEDRLAAQAIRDEQALESCRKAGRKSGQEFVARVMAETKMRRAQADADRLRAALERIAADGCVNAAPYCAGAGRTADRMCNPCIAAASLASRAGDGEQTA